MGPCYSAKIHFSVFSVAEKRLNTEVTETLSALCVEALEPRRTRRSSFSLRPTAALLHKSVRPCSAAEILRVA